MIRVDNLYLHADGGHYCLLAPEAPMKHPTTGEWIPGVVYTGADGLMRSTSRERWDERFSPVAAIAEEDLNETEMEMVRRCNPGVESGLDFTHTLESWHDSEVGITGHMLELAVAVTALRFGGLDLTKPEVEMAFTITTKDLQEVVQNYEIERIPEAHGFRFKIAKSFPSEG